MNNIVMKPSKEATYLENLRKERNFYRDNYNDALRIINAEIERIKNTRSQYIKAKKMNNMELMTSEYLLKVLIEVKRKLENDNNKNNKK